MDYIGNSVNNFRTMSTIKINTFVNDIEELLLLLIDKTKSNNNVKGFQWTKGK